MRHFLFSILLSPLFRNTFVATSARRTPPVFPSTLQYPVCKRNLICATPLKQDPRTIMTDLNQQSLAEVDILAELATPCEGEILGKNVGREDALKEFEKEKTNEEPALPKLSASDFRAYNSMAEHMEYFHNHFRQQWTLLYSACENNKRPSNLSLKQFLNTGIQLCSHLTAHHSIEEAHIFPILAAKMPEFKAGKNAAELLRQHKEIHQGMDAFDEYLKKCKSGETELELKVLKNQMNTWGEVLWKHLDQEVKTLGAENMRKYWSLEEMRRMPM